jgi:hypothetical protein
LADDPALRSARLSEGLPPVALSCSARRRQAPTRQAPALPARQFLRLTFAPTSIRDWSLYSNDPLRLTGADIAYVSDEDSTLDPDETKQPDDRNLSVIALFHLRRHPGLKNASLVCHYDEHAQLSRALPPGITECAVTRHRQFDENTESEFEAICR